MCVGHVAIDEPRAKPGYEDAHHLVAYTSVEGEYASLGLLQVGHESPLEVLRSGAEHGSRQLVGQGYSLVDNVNGDVRRSQETWIEVSDSSCDKMELLRSLPGMMMLGAQM